MEQTLILRQDRRRVDRNKRTTQDLCQLNQRHQEIINLHILGIKGPKIAEMLNISYNTVVTTIESTLGQEKLAIIRGARDAETVDVAKKMQEIIPKALAVYEKILTAEANGGVSHGGASIALQKATADSVLKDFSGLAVPKKVVSISTRLTPDLIEEIKNRGKEAARECGLIQTIEEDEGLFAMEVVK